MLEEWQQSDDEKVGYSIHPSSILTRVYSTKE